jgi:hypothetical protein
MLLIWDAFRDQPGGIWGLAAANNNPGRLIRANEIVPRIITWIEYAKVLVGSGWLTGLLAVVGGVSLVWRIFNEPRRRATLIDIVLATYLLAYVLAHWLVAFNTYDRYLLPVLPIMVVSMARGFDWLKNVTQRRKNRRIMFVPVSIGIGALYLVAACLTARDASEGRVQVGGDLGEHTGIDALAEYLNSRDLGAIVYDHWLGWELGYYMGSWSDKRRVYYPTPDALAEGALAQPDRAPRYFPVPTDEPVDPWLEALRKARFRVSIVYETPQFRVYELRLPL